MKRLIAAACVLLVLSASASGIEKIADVTTLEELQKVKPIKLENGWEVRLGLGEGGAEAGPWKLLYCLAKYPGTGRMHAERRLSHKGPGVLRWLGPVYTEIISLTGANDLENIKAIGSTVTPPREALHCQLISVAWKGRYRLRVLGEKDGIVAERIYEVARDRRVYWRVFAGSRRRQERNKVRYRVDPWGPPAFPRFDGHTAVVDFTKRSMKAPGETPLPGRVPEGDFWVRCNARVARLTKMREGERLERLRSMTLSLEKDVFVVRSDPKMQVFGDVHLLARWWVNGKPKPDKEGKVASMSHGNGLVIYVNEHRVKFGLPDILGTLKAGDKVALQVMYSPGKYRIAVLAKGAALGAMRSVVKDGVARVPMVSNRIEFAVTQAMLEARGKADKR